MATSSSSDDALPIGGNAGARLKSFVERVIRIRAEKKALGEDERDIYTEAKSVGFDTKILRKVVARAEKDRSKVIEEDQLIETYEHALSQLSSMME
jgi:uncharacterized protein (UPF0335 family)